MGNLLPSNASSAGLRVSFAIAAELADFGSTFAKRADCAGAGSMSLHTSRIDELFPGSSQLAALMRAKDWSATPLGPADAWPHSLRTIVRILLTSRFAMWMGWGPELTFFYNDAYAR